MAEKLDHFDIKEITAMQQFDISADKPSTFSISPKTASGKPATVFGKIDFTISPEGGALLFPSDDGTLLTVEAIAEMDFQTITISGNATEIPDELIVETQFQVRTHAGRLDHFDVAEVVAKSAKLSPLKRK